MRGRLHMTLTGILFLCLGASSWCRADQFVTEELRAWAKEAVAQEKGLKTQSPGTKTLAVLYFHDRTGLAQLRLLQKGLTVMLITDLSKVKEVQLVERARIQALVEELGLGASGLVPADTAPRVGRLLGANLIVGGDIVKEKALAFQLKSGLLNVPKEKTLGNPVARGRLLEELFQMEKDLVFEIIRLLKIDLTPELALELREPITPSLEALLYLFQAIEQGDEGNLEGANKLLDQALNEDPDSKLLLDAKREIAGLGSADLGRVRKECAAARNRLKKSVFRSRRGF